MLKWIRFRIQLINFDAVPDGDPDPDADTEPGYQMMRIFADPYLNPQHWLSSCWSLSQTERRDKKHGIIISIYSISYGRPLEGVKLSLDCAVADFLSPDQIVISLKGISSINHAVCFWIRRFKSFSDPMHNQAVLKQK
jgi:hypothetical protein